MKWKNLNTSHTHRNFKPSFLHEADKLNYPTKHYSKISEQQNTLTQQKGKVCIAAARTFPDTGNGPGGEMHLMYFSWIFLQRRSRLEKLFSLVEIVNTSASSGWRTIFVAFLVQFSNILSVIFVKNFSEKVKNLLFLCFVNWPYFFSFF